MAARPVSSTHDGQTLAGDVIINAAGPWASEVRGLEADQIRFFPVRGQILCFEARSGTIEPSLFSTRGILVPRRDGRLLAGSIFEEAGFNKTLTLGGMTHILRAATELVPSLSELPFREAWAGLRPAVGRFAPSDWRVAFGAERLLCMRPLPQRYPVIVAHRRSDRGPGEGQSAKDRSRPVRSGAFSKWRGQGADQNQIDGMS